MNEDREKKQQDEQEKYAKNGQNTTKNPGRMPTRAPRSTLKERGSRGKEDRHIARTTPIIGKGENSTAEERNTEHHPKETNPTGRGETAEREPPGYGWK